MKGLDLLMDLGKVSKTEHKVNNEHVPSTIQPDTLFTFTTEFKWLISMLKNKMISPRYCSEDIEYLKIDGIKKMAYPMRCFCDISLRKLDYHMSWYGNYGIAFEKSWGMQNDIQPVHYLNENSTLRKDISDAFQRILRAEAKEETETQIMLKDYLIHELIFYKPYQGDFVNRNTNEKSKKCFCDECEWRYVPDVRKIGLQQAIPDYEIPNTGLLTTYSNSMDGVAEVSLCFDYKEIKHIIIPTLDEYRQLVENIDLWELHDEKYDILSKIIVWERSRGDF